MLLSSNHGECVHVIENYFASSGWAIFFSTRDSYAFLTRDWISKKYNYYCRRAPWVISCFQKRERTQGCFTILRKQRLRKSFKSIAVGIAMAGAWVQILCGVAVAVCTIVLSSMEADPQRWALYLRFALRMHASYCHTYAAWRCLLLHPRAE